MPEFDDSLTPPERLRALWCAVLGTSLGLGGHGYGSDPGGDSFLHNESGPFAEARRNICDLAGIDPRAFDDAIRRRRAPPATTQSVCSSEPAQEQPSWPARVVALLSAAPRRIRSLATELGCTRVQAVAAIRNARCQGHLIECRPGRWYHLVGTAAPRPPRPAPRLEELLDLLRTGPAAAGELALALGVGVTTARNRITRARLAGHHITAGTDRRFSLCDKPADGSAA